MVGEAKGRLSGATEDEQYGNPRTQAAEAALAQAEQGICPELGALPQGALITERGLAGLLGRAAKSIRRAVRRGELPPPVRILGELRWTVGAILRHVENRLENAAREAEREKGRFEGNAP